MKTPCFLMCLIMVLGMVTYCQRVVKPTSEIVIGVMDLPCDEVWERVLKSLKNNKIPLLILDKRKEYIETKPVITIPLPGDSFQKMEEQYRIEIKCIKPLVTQITCQIQVRGFTNDYKWVVPKEVVKYERRFLDSLKFNK